MAMNDPIADMLTRIRNANAAKHDTVDIPVSKMKIAIANILRDEGYIAKYELTGEGVGQMIHVTLKYGKDKNEKIISGIKRMLVLHRQKIYISLSCNIKAVIIFAYKAFVIPFQRLCAYRAYKLYTVIKISFIHGLSTLFYSFKTSSAAASVMRRHGNYI